MGQQRVCEELRLSSPEIGWRRNIVAHADVSVDRATIWHTAIGDVPVLREQLVRLWSEQPAE